MDEIAHVDRGAELLVDAAMDVDPDPCLVDQPVAVLRGIKGIVATLLCGESLFSEVGLEKVGHF